MTDSGATLSKTHSAKTWRMILVFAGFGLAADLLGCLLGALIGLAVGWPFIGAIIGGAAGIELAVRTINRVVDDLDAAVGG